MSKKCKALAKEGNSTWSAFAGGHGEELGRPAAWGVLCFGVLKGEQEDVSCSFVTGLVRHITSLGRERFLYHYWKVSDKDSLYKTIPE